MRTICAVALLLVGSAVHAADFTSYVFWTPPSVPGVGALDNQAIHFTFFLRQKDPARRGDDTWETVPSAFTGKPGYSNKGNFNFKWDNVPGGKPSPPWWFDSTKAYEIRFVWNETIHSPEINPYVSYIASGDSGWVTIKAGRHHGFSAIDPLDIDGPY